MRFDLISWLTYSASTVSMLAVLGMLLRRTILEIVTNSIAKRFEKDLESFRSELRQKEDALRADLQSRQREIDVLRASIASLRQQSHSKIEDKRINAIEKTWLNTQEISKLRIAVGFRQIFKIEKMRERKNDPKLQESLRRICEISGVSDFLANHNRSDLGTSRLYLPPKIWAYYSTYNVIASMAALELDSLSKGFDQSEFLNEGGVRDTVIAALPHTKESFEKYGDSFAFHYFDTLHELLLIEIQQDLNRTVYTKEEISLLSRVDAALKPKGDKKMSDMAEGLDPALTI